MAPILLILPFHVFWAVLGSNPVDVVVWAHGVDALPSVVKLTLHTVLYTKLSSKMLFHLLNWTFCFKGIFIQIFAETIVLYKGAHLKGTVAWDFLTLVFCINRKYMGPRAISLNTFENIFVFTEIFTKIFLTSG